MYKRELPDVEKFRECVTKLRGHKSNIAAFFGVDRHTLAKWLRENEEYAVAVENARMKLFDDVLDSEYMMAVGVKDIQDGKFVGWIVRPDTQMQRYLTSTLGREEGFGERLEVDTTIKTDYAPKDVQDARDYLEFLQMKYPERTNEFIRQIEENC